MRKDDGLVPSNKYVLTVEGHDEQNNSITTQDAIGYGFGIEGRTPSDS